MSYKSQITANKALYHVCYKLSELDWNVMPTARNAAGVDILCINEEGKMISIQTKGVRGRDIATAGPGSPSNRIIADFWIIVTELDSGNPTCYILLPDEIEEGRETNINKKGEISHWLDRKYDIEPFKEKWERIA